MNTLDNIEQKPITTNAASVASDPSLVQFRKNRVSAWKKVYSGEVSARSEYNKKVSFAGGTYSSAEEIRKALSQADSNVDKLIETSKKLYATNPIYASVIDYISNMFLWRYKVTPHKSYIKSKAKSKKPINEDDFGVIYNLMLEAAEGLSIPTKFPAVLSLLFTTGSVYLTTICDEDAIVIDTILLPNKYCRKIGETQYGTNIIQFDCNYFSQLNLSKDEMATYIESFPVEIIDAYKKYANNPNERWVTLDPRFSTGLLLNDMSIPTYIYLLGGIINYEKYQDNELKRSANALKYLISHTMPHYQDNLIFEVEEVDAIHKSLKKVIEKGDDVRLITSYGDVAVHRIAENDTAENQVLSKAFASLFNIGGLNNTIFTGDSVEAIKKSLIRDQEKSWKFVEQLISFYTIAINN